MSTKGYIYVRNHPSYDVDDACKMGKSNNIPERDTQYATGEIKRGYFEAVFEVPIEKMGIVERLLQNEFRELNVKYDAGTEFYNKQIITLIEPYLCKLGIEYKKLSKQEISDLVRCNRVRKTINKINIQSLIHILKSKRTNKQIVSYIPRNDQTIIIGKSVKHFQQCDKGMLVLMCGVGKTLISLWITQELNSNTILIGVPNKLLLKQWEEVVCVLFHSVPYLIVSGGVDTENIMRFLENNQKCIVITTYSSAHKVYTATQNTRCVFSMKILDEVHHLTSNNMRLAHTTKKYIQMLNIPSVKQLSLTATLKQLESMCDDGVVVSNDNVEYFGEIIDRKCLLWAINENIICDYVIQTIITNEEQLEQQLSRFHIIEENDKRLFLSAFASLKSIFDGHSHHLLIYSNNKDNSFKLIQYIKMLLDDNYFDIPDLYYSNYHSEMKTKDQKEIINNFEKAKFGIITCVYCLGEGWDFPLLDGVVFAENMTSNIRIVQSALRASRKNKKDTNKKTKIILPIFNRDDWLENNENPDLKKVREVIYQMGLEDETITQKIKVFIMEIEKQKPKPKEEKEEREMVDEFGEYDDELTQKLRLKTIKRTALATTYEKARKIIADKNIKSKESYYELCDRDNRLSKEPEIVFKGQFTNWIEYLSIERLCYDLETCKNKVGEYLLLYPEIKKHYLDLSIVSNELCKLDILFPPNGLWVEYYNVKDLRDIITITNKKKKMGVIL
jgi:superfamily II DNA or RNA helicase